LKNQKDTSSRTVVIFGSSGRITRALTKALATIGRPVETMSWIDPVTRASRDRSEIVAQLSAPAERKVRYKFLPIAWR
jgi:NAD(P)-dependent dehydrogenase (short-subunit alcohol dehydrogenase family)